MKNLITNAPFLPSALADLMEMARQQACEKDRERVTIGYLYDIPPAQLSDEEIRKYKQDIWMRQLAATLPIPKQILHFYDI